MTSWVFMAPGVLHWFFHTTEY